MRAVASVPPPAAHGTINVTGRSGHAACAIPNEQTIARAAKALARDLRFISIPSHNFGDLG
jgi:hypothetical protein